MSDLPAHPIDAAIMGALQEALDALPVSLPAATEILAGSPSAAFLAPVGGEPGSPEGAATRARHALVGVLTRRWAYLAAAMVVLLVATGIFAALQFRPTPQGSASSNGPSAPAPSAGLGGGPSSTPSPAGTAPTPLPTASPQSLSGATPQGTPAPATTPAPARSSTPAPGATPGPSPVPSAAPTPAPSPTATPSPCPHPGHGHGC